MVFTLKKNSNLNKIFKKKIYISPVFAFKAINISAAIRRNSHKLWSQRELQLADWWYFSRGWPHVSKGAGQLGKCLFKIFEHVWHQRLTPHCNRIKTCSVWFKVIRTVSLERFPTNIDSKGRHLRICRLFKSATYQNKMVYQRKYKEGAVWLAGG